MYNILSGFQSEIRLLKMSGIPDMLPYTLSLVYFFSWSIYNFQINCNRKETYLRVCQHTICFLSDPRATLQINV